MKYGEGRKKHEVLIGPADVPVDLKDAKYRWCIGCDEPHMFYSHHKGHRRCDAARRAGGRYVYKAYEVPEGFEYC